MMVLLHARVDGVVQFLLDNSLVFAVWKQPWILLIPLVISGVAIWEFSSGRARFGAHVEFSREKYPVFFFALVIAKLAFSVWMVFIYFEKYIT